MTLLEQIKILRKKCGIVQRDMAQAFGISKRNYFEMENGKYSISEDDIPIFAKMLQTSSEELLKLWLAEKEQERKLHERRIRVTFLLRIKKQRHKLQLKQCDIAAALNIPERSYATIENGIYFFKETQLPIIAEILQIDPKELHNHWLECKITEQELLKVPRKKSDFLPADPFLRQIKELRLKKQITLRDMGNALGMSEQSYVSIEKGRCRMRQKQLRIIAKILQTNVDDLMPLWYDYRGLKPMDTNNMTFHELIKHLRTEENLTMREMGEALGMSPLNYLGIEKGRRYISKEQISIIAEMLQINAKDLLNRWLKLKDMTTLFELIQCSRKKLRITQDKLGKALGISIQSYSKLEKGQQRIRKMQIPIIAEMLQIDQEELFSRWETPKIDINNMTFLELIKYQRVELKLTQREMGEALGLSNFNYSAMESGRYHIKQERVLIIAKMLKLNPEDLLTRWQIEQSKLRLI